MLATSVLNWPLSPPATVGRRLLQFPAGLALDWLAPVEVQGAEVWRELSEPCLLAANHASHLDTAVLLRALPPGRRRLAVAAAADYFFANPVLGAIVALAVNAFPLPRRGNPRSALRHCARLIDRGWSILVYPEGTRSPDGRIGAFRPGIGWLAAALACPVVPAHLAGLHDVLPKGRHVPRPGRVRVRFGPPLRFAAGIRPDVVAAAVEAAVRRLAGELDPVMAVPAAGRLPAGGG